MVQSNDIAPLTVGVTNLVTRWHEVPMAPPLGELLSAAKLRGCTMMIGAHLRFAPHL